MWKIVLILFLFLALGGLFVYQNFFLNKNQTEIQPVQLGDNAIYVADQIPGPSIIVSLAVLSKDGYVVIYDNNNGEPGKIIGSTRLLPKGESRNITVGLLRPIVQGEVLFAMLHEDSGDGIFTPELDVPIRDENLNTIFMRFMVDRNATPVQDLKI